MPLCAAWLWSRSPVASMALLIGSHLPILYGTLRPNRQLYGPVVNGFRANGNEVWLTIDDGPDPHDTPRLLDLLDASRARATFFVRGDRAEAHPELIEEIIRRGHGVANHTYSHPQATFWSLSPRRMAREIGRCSRILRDLTGSAPRWFRAPVGMINPFVHRAAEAEGMRVVGWSARGYDGVISRAEPSAVVERILSELRPGGIALLHEGRRCPVAGEALNVLAMKELLDALARRGWRAVIPDDDSLV
jgi:peptidoglycan/xylan/chitin deacetylase (PgdA/CDA1 family)